MTDVELSRRDELLVDDVLAWTDDAARAELDALLRDPAALGERAAIERAAALAGLVVDGAPADDGAARQAALVARLHADAAAYFAARPRPGMPWSHRVLHVAPWLLAAASVALLLWPHGPSAPAAARAALLQQPATQWVRWDWQPGPSPRRGAVQGDVVWAVGSDEGYLRLSGLPALDAGHRYQLWIVDSARQGPPVDGGVLAMPGASGEVVVPVRARLKVGSEAAFVLTIEAADGVVVSAQEHVVAIAKP